MQKDKIVIVSGPTASGKSDIAIALAKRFNGEIISADSRQVYRGMDIGTGKVGRDKLTANGFFSSGIRHWLLDVATPTRQYSVARFKREAQKSIRDIVRRGKLPIICGGTGFWIDTLVYDLQLPDVKPNAKLRARLRKLTTAQLFARLKKLDPARAAAIDRHNPVRLIRALEIVLTTGQPVPPAIRNSPYDILYLALNPSPSTLRYRIEKRLDARLKDGMVAEVKRLHTAGVSWKRLESFGLEYHWLARYLQQSLKIENRKLKIQLKEQMRLGLLADILAYAKRQLTWWRKNPHLISITDAAHTLSLVNKFLKSVRKTK